MSNYIFSDDIIIGSRNLENSILNDAEIKARPNHQVQIKELNNEKVFRKTFIEGDPLSDVQILQETDVNFQENQGTSVSVAENGSDAYISIGCPAELISSNTGGVSVFYSSAGTFEEQQVLTITSGTSQGFYGEYSDIDENGDRVVFCDFANNQGNLMTYTRSGATWSSEATILASGISCKISGDYILTGRRNQEVRIYFDSGGGSWALQSTIASATSEGLIDLIDITNETTALYIQNNSMKIYYRTLTTWNIIQTIDLTDMGVIVGVKLENNSLVVCSNTGWRYYSRINDASNRTFTLDYSESLTAIVDICTNELNTFVSTTTGIYVYDSTFNLISSIISDTGAYKIACSTNWLVIGKPTNDSGIGETYVYSINQTGAVTHNLIDISTDDIKIKSTQGDILLNSDVIISGTLNCGTITGQISTDIIGLDNGSVSLPSLYYNNDRDTGMYLITTANPALSIGGVKIVDYTAPEITITNGLTFNNGYCIAIGDGFQTIGNNVETRLTSTYFDGGSTEDGDNGDYPTLSNGFIFINKTGFYQIGYSVCFSTNGTNFRYAYIQIDALGITSALAPVSVQASTGSVTVLTGSTLAFLTDGQFISVVVRQFCGGNLNMDDEFMGRFYAYRIS